MHVAIIGAGFAGLATCWELLKRGAEVTVYDALPIAHGTSGMAAGLLHAYAGVDARQTADGPAGVAATRELLDVASEALGTRCYTEGIMRLATSERQRRSFAKAARKHPDELRWSDSLNPLGTALPGIEISPSYAVDAAAYVRGLWSACAARGARLVQKRVAQRPNCDIWIVTAGHQSLTLPGCEALPLKSVKGQLLELAWPSDLAPPPRAVNAVGYLLMTAGGSRCIAGSTFEHDFASEDPDLEVAYPWILERMQPIFPSFDTLEVITCRAGVRAATPDHKPIIQRLSSDQWVLTGLGSKGLLRHALLAKRLAAEIY